MPLSRKYYNTIADILQEEIDAINTLWYEPEEPVKAVCSVSKELARYFLRDNPRFSKVRFIKASGCDDIIRTGDL